MEYPEFQNQLRDLLAHLYDYAAVETHPLAKWLAPAPPDKISRGKIVQKIIREAIERLRPDGNMQAHDPAWRPYLILKRRYLDGLGQSDLAQELALSERQLRRNQARALEALAQHLWENAAPPEEPAPSFQINPEPLSILEICQSVMTTLQPRLNSLQSHLHLQAPSELPMLESDRTVLRHILISMVNTALEEVPGQALTLDIQPGAAALQICLTGEGLPQDWHNAAWQRQIQPWLTQLHASLVPPAAAGADAGLCLRLPLQNKPVILVIDDQPPTIRMFQRYLQQTRFEVVGLNDPQQALATIQHTQPALITLDVMMPRMDGWELLQNLQSNVSTRHIPVVICSAWEEPELARSLGAAGFLKKPVTRTDFLEMLRSLDLL